jgi:hypothetical protein
MGREGKWRELGQGNWRPGIEGRDQLPQRLCTAGRRDYVGLNPHRIQYEAGQCSVLALAIEGSDHGPSYGMPDPKTTARVTEQPPPAACDPVQPASADPGCHGSCPRDQGVAIQRRSPRVKDAEQVVPEHDLGQTQRSETARDLLSKGGGFLAGHGDQAQCKSP